MKASLYNKLVVDGYLGGHNSNPDLTESEKNKQLLRQQIAIEFQQWRNDPLTKRFLAILENRRDRVITEVMSCASFMSEPELRVKSSQAKILTDILEQEYENWATET